MAALEKNLWLILEVRFVIGSYSKHKTRKTITSSTSKQSFHNMFVPPQIDSSSHSSTVWNALEQVYTDQIGCSIHSNRSSSPLSDTLRPDLCSGSRVCMLDPRTLVRLRRNVQCYSAAHEPIANAKLCGLMHCQCMPSSARCRRQECVLYAVSL